MYNRKFRYLDIYRICAYLKNTHQPLNVVI